MLAENLGEIGDFYSLGDLLEKKRPHGPPAKDKRTQKVLARYYDEIKAKQPGKSKEYYARVAWQRYCMYKNPENPSCGPAGKSKDVTVGPKSEDTMSLDTAFEILDSERLDERKPGAYENPYAGSDVDREKKQRSRNPRRSARSEKKAAAKAARRGKKKEIAARMRGEDLDDARADLLGEDDLQERLDAILYEDPRANVYSEPLIEGRPTQRDIKKKAVFFLRQAVKPGMGKSYLKTVLGDLGHVAKGRADASIAQQYKGWSKSDVNDLIVMLSPTSQRGQRPVVPSKPPKPRDVYSKPTVGLKGAEDVVKVGEFRDRVRAMERMVTYHFSSNANQTELERWVEQARRMRDEMERTTTKRGKPDDHERKARVLKKAEDLIKGVESGRLKRKNVRDRGASSGGNRMGKVLPFRRESTDPLVDARADLLEYTGKTKTRKWTRAGAQKKPPASGAAIAIWVGDSDHSAGVWPLDQWEKAVKTAKDIRKAGQKAALGYVKGSTRPAVVKKKPSIPSGLMVEEDLSEGALSKLKGVKKGATVRIGKTRFKVTGVLSSGKGRVQWSLKGPKGASAHLTLPDSDLYAAQFGRGTKARDVDVSDIRVESVEGGESMIAEARADLLGEASKSPQALLDMLAKEIANPTKGMSGNVQRTYLNKLVRSIPGKTRKAMWELARKGGKKYKAAYDLLHDIGWKRSDLDEELDTARADLLGEGINTGGVTGSSSGWSRGYYDTLPSTDPQQTTTVGGFDGVGREHNRGGVDGAGAGWYEGYYDRMTRVAVGDVMNVGPYQFEVKQAKHEPGMVKLMLGMGDGGIRDQFEMTIPAVPSQEISLVDYGGRTRDFAIGEIVPPNVVAEDLDTLFETALGGQLGTTPAATTDLSEVLKRAMLGAQAAVENYLAEKTSSTWRRVYAAPSGARNLFLGQVVRQSFECDEGTIEVNVGVAPEMGKHPVTVRCRKRYDVDLGVQPEWEETQMRMTSEELTNPARLVGWACKQMMS